MKRDDFIFYVCMSILVILYLCYMGSVVYVLNSYHLEQVMRDYPECFDGTSLCEFTPNWLSLFFIVEHVLFFITLMFLWADEEPEKPKKLKVRVSE